jgi:hypothetical protein
MQIEILSDINSKMNRPTQASFKTVSPYSSINNQMTEHLEKGILFLVKVSNKQKIDRVISLEKELNSLTQELDDDLKKIKDENYP